MGVIIDFITIGTISIGKAIGGILVLIGLTYNLIVDKNDVDCDEEKALEA